MYIRIDGSDSEIFLSGNSFLKRKTAERNPFGSLAICSLRRPMTLRPYLTVGLPIRGFEKIV
jgi:hypothetical protein